MPERKQVETLKKTCLLIVCKYISIYYTRELRFLSRKLCEDLIQLLFDKNCKKCKKKGDKNFLRLITDNHKKLSISFSNEPKSRFNKNLFSTLIMTCETLTHFTCGNTGTLTRQQFIGLVASIPNIVYLNIRSDNLKPNQWPDVVDDDVVEVIGTNCFELETLIVTSNQITDNGIRRLCLSISKGRNIKHLEFENSQIGESGCLYALRNLRRLKFFNHWAIIPSIIKFFQSRSQPRVFNLSQLPNDCEIDVDIIPDGFLRFIAKCFPNILNWKFKLEDSFDANQFYYLRYCHNFDLHLKSVSIPRTIMMDIGPRLSGLKLSYMKVDLAWIGSTCPNLRELSLWELNYVPDVCMENYGCQNPFSRVKKLILNSEETSPIPVFQLKYLLENCFELEEINITCNNEITDEILIGVLYWRSSLRRLRYFCIWDCGRLSKVSILKLIQSQNKLKTLVIVNCDLLLGPRCCSEMRACIRENNYDVDLYVREI